MSEPKHITGLAAFQKNISTYQYQFKKVLEDTIISMNKTIIKKAIKYTPIETGDLRKSYDHHVAIHGNKYVGVVTVGGTNRGTRKKPMESNDPKKRPHKPIAYYALYVHEDLIAVHAYPTQAKFLERAIREVQGTVTGTFAKNIKDYVSGGSIPKPTIEIETLPAKVNKQTGIDKAKPIVKKPDHKPHGS